ncbi:DUF3813 domain-containing protein [Anaerobacillus sp. MEB173]|uniref:DUF3813 domain-containing protein n=1 Tax=Anaerobacillus sp. MEB173 TaxID=3383345 RepID=UPI003F9105D7
MGNKLFQEARKAVEIAEQKVMLATTPEQFEDAIAEIEKAKNNLSSAFANSTTAEKEQLAKYQDQIQDLYDHLT